MIPVADAAAQAGIKPGTLLLWIRQGKIHAERRLLTDRARPRWCYVVDADEVERYISGQR